ncbi:MAG: DUF4838 domain-containing protein [Oscillospiraceae bacterium]|nr:DUF4838 domain-containing protein [Oscillospiraceae bacterium]
MPENKTDNLRSDYTEMTIFADGKLNCNVVVSFKAEQKVKDAAEDFCSILKKITGSDVPVCNDELDITGAKVLIGPSRFTDMLGIQRFKDEDPEAVILKRDGDTLILVGNDFGLFKGTQFAVTMFFEWLGCGWFGPDELWHVIPEKKEVRIGYLDILHKPQFVSRRNNVLQFFPEIGERWYLGGEHRRCGHALTGLVPREVYFEQHPEWFCMVDGQRNPFVEWWQYCYSNEQLVDLFAENICSMFAQNPDIKQFSIAANDGWYHGFCECTECQKLGNTTEQVMSFANRLAKKIGTKYPDHRLTVLSYFPTYSLPKNITELEPNIEIMFCKETDMFSPVDKGPDNGYHKKFIFNESKNEYPVPWKENFENWLDKVKPKHICIWDWYCITAAKPIWKDIPWVQGDVATRNIRYWHDQGIEYVYNDQGPLDVFYEDADSFPLRWPLWYVAAKAWWDKDLTGSDILMDACKKLYEDAADLMFAYYNCLADIAQSCRFKSIAWHPPEPDEMYTPENVERVDRIVRSINDMLPQTKGKVCSRIKMQVNLWQKAKSTIEVKGGL